jgi:hypothetical protein
MPAAGSSLEPIMHIISAAINTASDLILILLPQPVIWSLNMNWRRQMGLSAVFLVGGAYVLPWHITILLL